jgi:hypothetical protein
MNEANRLARCLGMTARPCTPIFELTEQLVGHLGAAVVRAYLEGDERGISGALAVRARAPILARDSALALARPATPDAGDDVRQWLDRVNPGDFEPGSAR